MLKNNSKIGACLFVCFYFLSFLMVFLGLMISTGQAAQKSVKNKVPAAQDQGEVEGFRTAHFGMIEKDVYRSIYKDFGISKKNVERQVHPLEKTVNLGIVAKDLLPQSGPARVYYVLGYKSHRLIQVNVVWGKPVVAKPNAKQVVNLANQLRKYFSGYGFVAEGLVMNAPLGKDAIMVFRGLDKKGRMVLLLLDNPKKPEGPPNQDITLKLSYIQNPGKPDVFQIEKGKF
jgi:hypothetical protein